MYRVLITGTLHPNGIEILRQENDIEVDYRPELPMQTILEEIANYHCIITRSETPIHKELIDRATNLKVIARAAVGIANIDVNYATDKGILVINTPGKNTNSAAELTMGILLAAVRKITLADSSMRLLKWDRHRFSGSELLDKTIGIVGLGNVGHRVAQFAKGFDMKVLAYDPYIADEVFERYSVRKVSWDTLIKESDIISVHTPRNSETIGMIGKKEIAKMKPGVILLNLARGGIIEEKALLEGIQSGHVVAAGVDTWDVEPPKENPFKEFENIVMSPHIGASTQEAQQRVSESIASQVPRALRGEVVDYPVNMPQIKMLEGGNLLTSYTVLAEKLGMFSSQFISFTPTHCTIKYRGSLAKQDCSLLRLAFLKGLLKHSLDYVSYVNAEQRAESVGLHVENINDPGFNDYESALKITLSNQEHQFEIGGVVFSGPHPRITLVNGFVCELGPEGTILTTVNRDCPGMVGIIGTILGKHKINIDQFELGRKSKGGEAMALIRVDDDIPNEVIEELLSHENITNALKIRL